MSFTDYSTTRSTYHVREMRMAQQDAERLRNDANKDTQAAVLDMMRDPARASQRIGWLLEGHYGYAQHYQAWQTVKGRGNKSAALMQQIGLWECRASETQTRKAWRMLTVEQRAALNEAINEEISAAQTAQA